MKIFSKKSAQNGPNCYVFGIVGKLFKNVSEWCLYHANISNKFWVKMHQKSVCKHKIAKFISSCTRACCVTTSNSCLPNLFSTQEKPCVCKAAKMAQMANWVEISASLLHYFYHYWYDHTLSMGVSCSTKYKCSKCNFIHMLFIFMIIFHSCH